MTFLPKMHNLNLTNCEETSDKPNMRGIYKLNDVTMSFLIKLWFNFSFILSYLWCIYKLFVLCFQCLSKYEITPKHMVSFVVQRVTIRYYFWELSYSGTQPRVPSASFSCLPSLVVRHFSRDPWVPSNGQCCLEAKIWVPDSLIATQVSLFTLISIQYHRSCFDFLPLHTCDSLFQQWEAWLQFSLVYIRIWLSSLHVIGLLSLRHPLSCGRPSHPAGMELPFQAISSRGCSPLPAGVLRPYESSVYHSHALLISLGPL